MKKVYQKLLMLLMLCMTSVVSYAVTASFTYSVTSTGCAFKAISFTNTSSGATSYYWNFGNGHSATSTNPNTSYSIAGTYTVMLAAHGAGGNDTTYTTITVPNPVTVSFTASDTSICPGDTVTFTSASTAANGGPVTNSWNIDGVTSTGTTVTHAYTSVGYSTVYLASYDTAGCPGAHTYINYIHVNAPPVAEYTVPHNFYLCDTPFVCLFTSTSTGAGPFSYVWRFGDGSANFSSSADTVSHLYHGMANVTDTLIVTDVHGCKDTIRHTIHKDTVYARFTDAIPFCTGIPVTFHNTSSTLINSTWYFGDATTLASNLSSVSHTYITSGDKDVSLVVNDTHCADTIEQTITIHNSPTAGFTIDPAILCTSGDTATFSGYPHFPNVTWTIFNTYGYSGYTSMSSGGTGDTVRDPLYTGLSTIQMIVTDIFGCKDTVDKQDTVYNKWAYMNIGTADFCVPATAHFYARGYTDALTHPYIEHYPSQPVTYFWNFGDTSLHGADLVHDTLTTTDSLHTYVYTDTGVYQASCAITYANGCIVTAHETINVGSKAHISFIDSPTHVCYGQPVRYIPYDSSGLVDFYVWHIGDGTIDTTYPPNDTLLHISTNPGSFVTTLFAFHQGCYSNPYTNTDTIRTDSPSVNITPVYSCTNRHEVTFNSPMMGVDTFLWSFGDTTTSTTDSPSHIFALYSTPYVVTLIAYNALSGCHDTATDTIRLADPTMIVGATDTSFCLNNATFLCWENNNPDSIFNSFDWYRDGVYQLSTVFPDPDPDVVLDYFSSLTDSFTTAGIHTMMVVTHDVFGCDDTAKQHFYVASPIAGFSAVPNPGCGLKDTVIFTDTSTDSFGRPITHYSWYYGDGSTTIAGATTETHIYNNPASSDTFVVTEVVRDSLGCVDTARLPVISHRTHASFSAVTKFPCRGVSTTFTNHSTTGSSSHSYLWSFGDGGLTSTQTSPTHIYTAAGVDTVRLTVTDLTYGCTDDTFIVVTVTGTDASIVITDSTIVCAPQLVNFHASVADTTGTHTYTWTVLPGVNETGADQSFEYTTAGIYTITMVAVNAHGCSDTVKGHVKVLGFTGDFLVSQHIGCTPLTVTFGTDTIPNGSVLWTFDDLTSSLDTILYTFTTPGMHIVNLHIVNDSGCFSNSADTVYTDAVIPSFVPSHTSLCLGLSDSFANTSISMFSHIISYSWTFGDGGTSMLASPTHLYTAAGTYTVTVRMTDSLGCGDSVSQVISVFPQVGIILIGHTVPVCVGSAVTLYDSVTGGTPAYTYSWSGPASFFSTAHNPVISPVTSTSAGTYMLTVTDVNGCTATSDTTLTFNPLPDAGSISGADSVCIGDSITLTETVTGGTWSASNGHATVHPTGVVTGVSTGVDTIRYTYVNSCGTAVATHVVNVHGVPIVGAITGPTRVCIGATIALSDATAGGTWSSLYTSMATVSSAGVVTGVGTGVDTIRYTVTNTCGSTTVKYVDTVNLTPVINPSPASVCVGSRITLSSSASGGVWSRGNSVLDGISAGGVDTGKAAGIDTIKYTVTATGCVGRDVLTVNPLPAAITGPSHVCIGDTIVLTDTTVGGHWIRSTSNGTYVSANDTLIMNIRGNTPGPIIDTYRIVATGCYVTKPDTVYYNPADSIVPASAVYCGADIPIRVYAYAGTTGTYATDSGFTYDWAPTLYTYIVDYNAVTGAISTDTTLSVTITDKRGCTTVATAHILVACSDICAGGSVHTLGVGDTIHTGTYTGNYYLDDGIAGASTISLTGDVTLSGAVVAIAPRKTISIPIGKTLTIDGSHLFSCRPDTMWQGIIVSSTGTSTGKLVIINHSLIEDAKIAVRMLTGLTSAPSADILTVNNATFNRDSLALHLGYGLSTPSTFPYNISNTIFTSRDFTGYYDGTNTYPFAWPYNSVDLRLAYSPASGSIVQPPYNIDNPHGKHTIGGDTAYTKVQCKQTTAGDAYAGIFTTGMGNTATTAYPGLYIDGSVEPNYADSMCMFDNLNYGILAQNANLTVSGSVFMYIHPRTGAPSVGGRGIRNLGGSDQSQLSVNLPTATAADGHQNLFYDCGTAVSAFGMHATYINYNEVYSDHYKGTDSTVGRCGIRVSANSTVDTASAGLAMEVNHNYIGNIDSGIVFTDQENMHRNVHITNNQIVATPPSWSLGYTTQGINALSGGTAGANTGTVNIDNNEIFLANNGIYVSSFKRQTATSNNNTIMLQYSGLPVTYGIRHLNSLNNKIQHNYVTSNDPQLVGSAIGISGENNTLAVITCDSVLILNKGFNFSGSANTTTWRRNSIDSCVYGFYLGTSTSYIGSGTGGTDPFDNVWYGTWPVPTRFQTFNNGSSSPTLSAMWVRNNAGTQVFDPYVNAQTGGGTGTNTFGYPGPFLFAGCFGTGLNLSAATPTWAPCVPMDVSFPLYRDYEPGATDTISNTDSTGQGGQRSANRGGAYVTEREQWIAQKKTWDALQIYPALADSSAILAKFQTMAANSRYAWLTNIENYLNAGNYINAQTLMSSDIDAYVNTNTDSATGVVMVDKPEADYVVGNYLAYYSLLSKFFTDTLNTDDIEQLQTLAGLCPNTDGMVVYQARNLYSQFGGSTNVSDEDCSGSAKHTNTSPADPGITFGGENGPDQSYRLYPNPNNGNINIAQKIADMRGVKVGLYNSTGQVVYTGSLQFTQQNVRVHIQNITPGLYMLQITDADGKTFNLKFVVQ